MKILNLYAGIGGNRKLWGDEHDITSVENVDYIADVYAHFYPQDTLIREDAHQYLLEHYKEFDFIWSSPPCPTHSRMNTSFQSEQREHLLKYPDMKLYQEILFLKHFYRGKWIVENVIPYYEVLIMPRNVIDRHCVWTNFAVSALDIYRPFAADVDDPPMMEEYFGFQLPAGLARKQKRTMLRNIAHPEMGAHILKAAMRETKQETLL